MMPKGTLYKLAKDGYESDYEEDGTHYQSVRPLGSGRYSSARLFKSKPHGRRQRFKEDKWCVVLMPSDEYEYDSLQEAANKYNFFSTLYGADKVFLMAQKNTYRLKLPLIEGESLGSIDNIVDKEEQILHALGLIHMLKFVHCREYVIIDFNCDNFLFRYENNQIVYSAIDGGLSRLVNDYLPNLFIQKDQEKIDGKRKKYYRIAPECWDFTLKSAQFSMDIYGYGALLMSKFKDADDELNYLLKKCTDIEPDNRPSVDTIIIYLTDMLNDLHEPRLC